MAKKYYWLRLKDDWFKSKPVKKLRKIAGGDTYTIIYLKMQLLSLKHEGRLYYEGIESNFIEELALDLDEDIDNVKVTVNFLQSCGLLEVTDNDEFTLTEVPQIIGCETASAERKRRSRANQNKKMIEEKSGQCHNLVTDMSQPVTRGHTEIEIEKREREELEKKEEIREENIACSEPKDSEPPFITMPLNTGEEFPFFEEDLREFSDLYPAVDVMQAMKSMRGWLLSNPEKRKTKRGIRRFVNSWLARDQDSGGTKGYKRPTQNNQSSVEQYADFARGWAESD